MDNENEFDTGSGYQDSKSPEEQAFEKALNLDEREKKIVQEIDKRVNEEQSKYTFWRREFDAKPPEKQYKEYQFKVKLWKETAQRFEWLMAFCVRPGFNSSSDIIGEILGAGIAYTYGKMQNSAAAGALMKQSLSHLPPEIAQATIIANYRQAIEKVKEVQEQELKESLEGGE